MKNPISINRYRKKTTMCSYICYKKK